MSTTALVSLFVTCSLCLSCSMLLFDVVGECSLGSLLPGLMSFLRGVNLVPFGSLRPLLDVFRFDVRRVLSRWASGSGWAGGWRGPRTSP